VFDERAPDLAYAPVEGGRLAVRTWPGPGPDAPILLFSHANGFHGLCYRRIFERLADVCEVRAIDLRGHGLSEAEADPRRLRGFGRFGEDVAAVAAASPEGRRVVLAGHSLGGTASILAGAALAGRIARVAAVDPVLLEPLYYRLARAPLIAAIGRNNPLAKAARARRAAFPSKAAALENYASKRLFATWEPGVLADYVDGAFDETDDGVRLRCAPEWEAAIFGAQGTWPYGAVGALGERLCVLKAGRGSTVRAPGRLEAAGARIETTQAGHLAPMETPAAVAAWLGRLVA